MSSPDYPRFQETGKGDQDVEAANNTNEYSATDQRLDRLYVPVKAPKGSDELLGFQWMRPHPATVMACLPGDDEETTIPTPILQLSRAFPAYRAAMADANDDPLKADKVKSTECEREHNDHSTSIKPAPLVQATGVQIDLCDYLLPEPPSSTKVAEKILDFMGNEEDDLEEEEMPDAFV